MAIVRDTTREDGTFVGGSVEVTLGAVSEIKPAGQDPEGVFYKSSFSLFGVQYNWSVIGCLKLHHKTPSLT
jgi:hypothetical protein